jgi:hypothetical protein
MATADPVRNWIMAQCSREALSPDGLGAQVYAAGRCRAGEAAVVHDGDQVASVAEQHVITPTYRDSKETVLDTYTTGAQI